MQTPKRPNASDMSYFPAHLERVECRGLQVLSPPILVIINSQLGSLAATQWSMPQHSSSKHISSTSARRHSPVVSGKDEPTTDTKVHLLNVEYHNTFGTFYNLFFLSSAASN